MGMEDAMVDRSPVDPEVPDEASDDSTPPAPLGRTFLLIAIALAISTGICCFLNRDELPAETGTIKGRTAPMVSDWSGRIERYLIEPGQSVEAGDPIAVLIDEHLILEIDRLKRDVAQIETALEHAEASVDAELSDRLQLLDTAIADLRSLAAEFPLPAESAARLKLLETERINAAHAVRESLGITRIRHELVKATASLRYLESQSVRITVPAPVTGSVRKLLRQPGERIVQGTPFLELADRDQPYLIVEVPEATAKRFALGDTIPLKFLDRAKSIGRVANMQLVPPAEGQFAKAPEDAEAEPRIRMEIEPQHDDWPDMPLKSPVRVRTSRSDALSRRVH
jgi:multidrug resistance efflux pump